MSIVLSGLIFKKKPGTHFICCDYTGAIAYNQFRNGGIAVQIANLTPPGVHSMSRYRAFECRRTKTGRRSVIIPCHIQLVIEHIALEKIVKMNSQIHRDSWETMRNCHQGCGCNNSIRSISPKPHTMRRQHH